MNNNYVYIGVAVFVVLLAVLFFMRRSPSKPSDKSTGKPTIYGSLGCPYTVKQMEKYPDHVFVDCTKEKCPDFVTAYPTTKWSDGKIEVGFS